MEETLKLILEKVSKIDVIEQELKELRQGQRELRQSQNSVNDKLDSFEKRTMSQFGVLEKKIDIVYNAVGDLMEFKGEAEGKLKKIK